MKDDYKYAVGFSADSKYLRELPLSVGWMKGTYGVDKAYISYFNLYSLAVL